MLEPRTPHVHNYQAYTKGREKPRGATRRQTAAPRVERSGKLKPDRKLRQYRKWRRCPSYARTPAPRRLFVSTRTSFSGLTLQQSGARTKPRPRTLATHRLSRVLNSLNQFSATMTRDVL